MEEPEPAVEADAEVDPEVEAEVDPEVEAAAEVLQQSKASSATHPLVDRTIEPCGSSFDG